MTFSYLIIVRPPVRDICIDALEDLWRNCKSPPVHCPVYFVVLFTTPLSPSIPSPPPSLIPIFVPKSSHKNDPANKTPQTKTPAPQLKSSSRNGAPTSSKSRNPSFLHLHPTRRRRKSRPLSPHQPRMASNHLPPTTSTPSKSSFSTMPTDWIWEAVEKGSNKG